MASVELCPKCHTSIALNSHKLSFVEDFARAYRNPSEFEVSRIASSLEHPLSEMADLVQEIARVDSILIALKAHHAHLDAYIQRSRQFIRPSSVRRLPTEVLGIIFASACTSFQRSDYKTPLSISLVCSKWRDIALSTPSLWTHIYVAPHSSDLDVYTHFLKRCGNIPISVKIDIPYSEQFPSKTYSEHIPYEETINYHMDLVSAIGRTCAQWKVAELCMNQEDTNTLLGYRMYGGPESSVLESLTLVNDGPMTYVETDWFKESSSLTDFSIRDCDGDSVRLGYYIAALPWSQLRKICAQSYIYSLSRHLNTLEDDHKRTLILRPTLYDLDLPRLNRPFSLRVSTLVLDPVIWTSSLTDFFRSITVPTLESLTMSPPDPSETGEDFIPDDWTSPFSALPQFLDRSGCALQTLIVRMRGRYEGETYSFSTAQLTIADSLVAALHSMTDLRALRIIESESGPSLLNEQLFQEMADGHLLPEVTSLELVWAEEHQPADTLISMLNSRCGQSAAATDTISSVVLGVRNGGDLRGDVLDCMAGLRQRGIRVTLW